MAHAPPDTGIACFMRNAYPEQLMHQPDQDLSAIRKKTMTTMAKLCNKNLSRTQTCMHAIAMIDRFLKAKKQELENVHAATTACAAIWIASKYNEDAIRQDVLLKAVSNKISREDLEKTEAKMLAALNYEMREPNISYIIKKLVHDMGRGMHVGDNAEKFALRAWLNENERHFPNNCLAAWSVMQATTDMKPGIITEEKFKVIANVLRFAGLELEEFMDFLKFFAGIEVDG